MLIQLSLILLHVPVIFRLVFVSPTAAAIQFVFRYFIHLTKCFHCFRTVLKVIWKSLQFANPHEPLLPTYHRKSKAFKHGTVQIAHPLLSTIIFPSFVFKYVSYFSPKYDSIKNISIVETKRSYWSILSNE